MVTWALLLPLLVAVAQAQGTGGSGRGAGWQAGAWQAPTLPLQLPVCSVEKNFFEVSENTSPGQLLLNITVPEGQQVTLGPSPTRFAFRIQGTQLFLNVTPDYEVWMAGPGLAVPMGSAGVADPPWAPGGHPHSSPEKGSLGIFGSQFAQGASRAPRLG